MMQILEIIDLLLGKSIQTKNQGHLANGYQTSGNLLNLPYEPIRALRELLIKKIDDYNQLCQINTDKNFFANWKKNIYTLHGWAIIMNKGGSLAYHNHLNGWLSGTFYMQMPDEGDSLEEGAIEFSHQGPKYPAGKSLFRTKLIAPCARDLNIFSSSLFHRTLPFQGSKQRICIAFDVVKN